MRLIALVVIFCSLLFALPTSGNIISLAPNCSEIICYLGGAQRLIAVTNDCNYPLSVKQKSKIGKYTYPNLEKIVFLQPAVVVIEDTADPRFIQHLKKQKIAVAVYNLKDLNVFIDQLKKMNRDMGFKAENKIATLEQTLLKNRVTLNRGKVLILLWQNPYMAAGSDTFLAQYFKLLGYQNCLKVKKYPILSPEYLYFNKPDLIINLSGKKLSLKTNPKFKPKVVDNLDLDVMLRLSPRLIEYYDKIHL